MTSASASASVFASAFVVAALFVVGSAGHAQPAAPAPLVVRLGQASPLSGPAAHLGRDHANGVRMAIDDLNARGLAIGGRAVRFELVAEDDAGDPRQAVAVAQKFCDQGVAGVVGHQFSGTTIPASKVYAGCGLPHVSAVATNPQLTRQGFRTSLRILANDDVTGVALARHAAATLKLAKVAVVDDRSAYGQGLADAFAAAARARGVEIVGGHFTSDRQSDFAALLTAIKASGATAIFYGGLDAQAGPMLRQMQALGLAHVRLLGGDGVCTPRLAELAGGASNAALAGVVCGEGGASIERMPGGARWKARYDARFAGEFQGASPYAYDAATALAEAMVRAGSAEPRAYLPRLLELDMPGVTGRIAFDARGEPREPATTLFRFDGGRKVALD